MRRQDLREFHHITAFANVASILEEGILAHDRAAGRQQADLADPEVQERRRRIVLPSGRRLHDYACLYVDARNAMLYRLVQEGRQDLAVLAVDVRVLDLEGVIVTDRNAASGVALFNDAATGIRALESEKAFATWWIERDARQRRCAEVLVPARVPQDHILHAYVPSHADAGRLRLRLASDLDIRVSSHLFFGEGPR